MPSSTKHREPFWIRRPRSTLTVLTLSTTGVASWLFARLIGAVWFNPLEAFSVSLFAVLFVWISFSFWVATLGLASIMRGRQMEQSDEGGKDLDSLPRTAILMPVYNEEPSSVFAGLRAIIQSIRRYGASKLFDVFVLSDTTDPDIWLDEERTWARLVAELPSESRVFYRHRAKNHGRKAGNIADFCTTWGDHYQYMIVLDADSVMAAETLVEMVRRIDRDPTVGILQVPPKPVGRKSVFARMQQFASRVYGPVFLEGFALWSQQDGNYWGHNAIIRTAPFIEHCDLPVLPGDGPLGGEILSHDFVEAALMRKAGWKVCLAHDLNGSYEECPTTMLDYAQRDERWCQGNLQHAKLLLAEGLHPASRFHLGMGVMSYLTSPLWLAFLVLTILGAALSGIWLDTQASMAGGLMLFVIAMAMLLLPKVWGVIALSRRPDRVAAHGGWFGVLVSVLLETLLSALIAPIMMLLHTQFVVSTLLGRKVVWNAQPRDDHKVSFRGACAMHCSHTLFGLCATALVWLLTPALLPWMAPVLIGPVFSVPLSMFLGDATLGHRMARANLLLIPEELRLPAILRWQQEAIKPDDFDRSRLFASVLYDPAFYALHVGILRSTRYERHLDVERLRKILRSVRGNGADSISAEDRRALLGDPHALETLHVDVRSRPRLSREAVLP